jgi:hypothetical protein
MTMRIVWKTNVVKWISTASVVVVTLLLWAVPSDLAYNVAQQREILLGRYTIDRLTTLLLLTPVSLLIIKGIWSKKKKEKSQTEKKKRFFQTIALSMSIIFSVLTVDVLERLIQRQHYAGVESLYHRIPHRVSQAVYKDVPKTAFSYPRTPPGYQDIEYTLTVDKRGFRNKTDLEKYDVVVLGDSFTEGSDVSDNQVWPVLFAQKSNRTVYNLGMSGGNPVTYLETLKKFGLELTPKMVVCMLYEGNDFRDSNFSRKKTESRWSLHRLFDTSPLRLSIKRAIIRYFGPINSNRQKNASEAESNKPESYSCSHPLYAVSWLPLDVSDGPDAKYYAFKIKRLLSHFESEDYFLDSANCEVTFMILRKIRKICSQHGIRFIIMYAPDKPHTLLPLVKHKLSAQKLHAFMALKEQNLPPAEELMDILLPRLQVQESTIEEFCQRESIEFISLTQPLRQEILHGRQVYFTYDQHWTPIGHEIAANTLYHHIEKNPETKTN